MADQSTVIVGNTDHVHFIRCLMLNRLVYEDQCVDYFNRIFQNTSTLSATIETLNNQLDASCNLKIVSSVCEVTSRKCFVLISTHYRPDKIFPGSCFSEAELEYIRSLINEIVLSDVGVVSQMTCLNLESKLSKTEVQSLLNRLISENWFIEPRKGKLAFSPLIILELEPYFRQHYKTSISVCPLCKRSIFYGDSCKSCQTLVHQVCIDKYKSTMKKVKCPSCGENWYQSEQCHSFDEAMDYEESD